MLNPPLRLFNRQSMFAAALAACAALFVPAQHAAAQSINFDYSTNFGTGPWWNAPSDAFGGAHGQTGHWIHSGALINFTHMVGVDDAVTGANLTISGGGPVQFMDHPALSGDFESMMGDWLNADPGDPITLTFTNLFPGVYTVYTYSNALICSTCRSNVAVVPSIDVVQTIGGTLTTNSPVLGLNYARHRVYTSNGTITIGISAQTTAGAFNGVQLVFHGRTASRLYVDSAATGAASGTSWTNANLRLDDALAVAEIAAASNAPIAVNEIWVANGTYRPTRNGNRSDSFMMQSGVQVYGGFAGGESSLSERDPAANICILSGNIGNILISGDNSCHVVDFDTTDSAARLDGFRVSSGNASGSGSDGYGGGVYMLECSSQVRNCVISGNHAAYGGGLWTSGDSPDIVSCQFLNNSADSYGGAARILGGAFVASFYNCLFAGNSSDGYGGGASSSGQQAWFVNCVFTGNSAVAQGGAIHSSGEAADVKLVNSTLYGNSSDAACGGIYMTSGADDEILNSILWANTDGDILTNTRQAQYFALDASSTQDLDYSTIQGWNLVQGAGNNGTSPQFIDPDGVDNTLGTVDDNLRVALTSPMIDSANNANVQIDWVDLDDDGQYFELTPFDFDRHARQINVASVPDTGSGASPIVDRGAFEAITPCAADVNGDSVVNVADLLAVITNWGATGGNPADVNGDSVVNVADLLMVIQTWGACP